MSNVNLDETRKLQWIQNHPNEVADELTELLEALKPFAYAYVPSTHKVEVSAVHGEQYRRAAEVYKKHMEAK